MKQSDKINIFVKKLIQLTSNKKISWFIVPQKAFNGYVVEQAHYIGLKHYHDGTLKIGIEYAEIQEFNIVENDALELLNLIKKQLPLEMPSIPALLHNLASDIINHDDRSLYPDTYELYNVLKMED